MSTLKAPIEGKDNQNALKCLRMLRSTTVRLYLLQKLIPVNVESLEIRNLQNSKNICEIPEV